MSPPRLTVAFTLEQCWHRVPGGTAVAALGMARALAERGDLDIVGVSARHRSAPPDPWRPPVPVRALPLPRPVLYEAWHRLRRPRVEAATGKVSAIHATTVAMPPRSSPIVLTIHDLAWLENPAHFTPRGLRFFDRGLELALRDADLVLCSSAATERACRAAGFEEARLRRVPLGVDIREATPGEVDRVRGRYSLGRPYVLWTGTVEPRKNLPGLVQAFDRLDGDLDLVLAGPRGWNEDLEALVGPRGQRVRFLGFVPALDLGPLYAGASAFCFPSLLEGFGFPVLEAMAQGTPVVTSRGTSTEELADGAGVLVDPLEPASIAAGLEEILSDPGLAARLGAAGRRKAAEYTWARTADLVARAYREVSA